MTLGSLVIKILIIAYNEGGIIGSNYQKQTNLNSHLLTF